MDYSRVWSLDLWLSGRSESRIPLLKETRGVPDWSGLLVADHRLERISCSRTVDMRHALAAERSLRMHLIVAACVSHGGLRLHTLAHDLIHWWGELASGAEGL